jgi:hypothetical protein
VEPTVQTLPGDAPRLGLGPKVAEDVGHHSLPTNPESTLAMSRD